MGGPRASTERMRAAGKMCVSCHTMLDPPAWPKEQYCARCSAHRVYCIFRLAGQGWRVRFMEENLYTQVGRERTFGSSEKILEMIARTPTRLDLAGKQALEAGIAQGNGALFLLITPEQHEKLKA